MQNINVFSETAQVIKVLQLLFILYVFQSSIPSLENWMCHFCIGWNNANTIFGLFFIDRNWWTDSLRRYIIFKNLTNLLNIYCRDITSFFIKAEVAKICAQDTVVVRAVKTCLEAVLSEFTTGWGPIACFFDCFFLLLCWQYGRIPRRRNKQRNYCCDCNNSLTNDWKVKWIGWAYRLMEF